MLPLLAPLIDIFTLYGMIFISPGRTAAAWLGLLAIQAATALYAFRLDRERPWPLLLLPLQQIIYRQVMYLVLVSAVVSAISGRQLTWQKLTRVGNLTPTPSAVNT